MFWSKTKINRHDAEAPRSFVGLEPLERREFLSASPAAVPLAAPTIDLTGQVVNVAMPSEAVVGTAVRGSLMVILRKFGTDALPANQKIAIALFLRPVGATDNSQDVAINTPKPILISGINKGEKNVKLATAIPKTMPAGTYKIVAVVDSGNALAETNEANNTVVLDFQTVRIAAPFEDPTIDSFSHSFGIEANHGAAGKISFRVNNNGNVNARGVIALQVILSAGNQVSHTLFQTEVAINIRPGASKSFTVPAKLPSDITQDTSFEFIARILDASEFTGNTTANDRASGLASIKVKAPKPAPPLLDIGLGNRFTFTRTRSGPADGVQGTIDERGTVRDERGNVGTYEYTLFGQSPKSGMLFINFLQSRAGFPALYVVELRFTTRGTALDGKTVEVLASKVKSHGRLERLNGSPTSTGIFELFFAVR